MRRLPTLLAAFAVLLVMPALAQTDTAPSPETRPKNKAEEIAKKIEKQVEKLRGLKFAQPVKIGVYDRATLKAFLLKNSEKELSDARLGPMVRGLKALALVPPDLDFKKVILEVLNEQIAGFYDPDTKELRLIDRSADGDSAESKKSGMQALEEQMMKSLGIDADAVVMAHELTHALQDQYAGLKTLPIEVEDDDDLVTAAKSLVEGDAMLSMMGWMMLKMGMPSRVIFEKEVSSKLDELKDLSSIPGADAVANAPAYIREGLVFPYLGGLKFCLAIASKDKNFTAIDAALKAPPLSMEQVIHPEKYRGEGADYPMTIALPDLAPVLEAPRLTTNTLGELFTRILLAEKVDADLAARAAEGWDGDRYALYGKPGVPDQLVWASTWDTPEETGEFETSLESWLAALHPGEKSQESDVTSARFARADGTVDAIARKGNDVFLLRAIPKDKVVPVLQALFEGTKKTERRKV